MRIADFGLSVISNDDHGRKCTILYSAPGKIYLFYCLIIIYINYNYLIAECRENQIYDRKADYFSAGVLLYELSQKIIPFKCLEDLQNKDPEAALRVSN